MRVRSICWHSAGVVVGVVAVGVVVAGGGQHQVLILIRYLPTEAEAPPPASDTHHGYRPTDTLHEERTKTGA